MYVNQPEHDRVSESLMSQVALSKGVNVQVNAVSSYPKQSRLSIQIITGPSIMEPRLK